MIVNADAIKDMFIIQEFPSEIWEETLELQKKKQHWFSKVF